MLNILVSFCANYLEVCIDELNGISQFWQSSNRIPLVD